MIKKIVLSVSVIIAITMIALVAIWQIKKPQPIQQRVTLTLYCPQADEAKSWLAIGSVVIGDSRYDLEVITESDQQEIMTRLITEGPLSMGINLDLGQVEAFNSQGHVLKTEKGQDFKGLVTEQVEQAQVAFTYAQYTSDIDKTGDPSAYFTGLAQAYSKKK